MYKRQGVGGEIVYNLGSQSSEVDRIGRGGQLAQPVHALAEGRVAEEPLDAGLGLIKIAPYPDDVGVVSAGEMCIRDSCWTAWKKRCVTLAWYPATSSA